MDTRVLKLIYGVWVSWCLFYWVGLIHIMAMIFRNFMKTWFRIKFLNSTGLLGNEYLKRLKTWYLNFLWSNLARELKLRMLYRMNGLRNYHQRGSYYKVRVNNTKQILILWQGHNRKFNLKIRIKRLTWRMQVILLIQMLSCPLRNTHIILRN